MYSKINANNSSIITEITYIDLLLNRYTQFDIKTTTGFVQIFAHITINISYFFLIPNSRDINISIMSVSNKDTIKLLNI